MKALRRLLTVLIMAAGLFGCGPVPQPFRHDDVSQVPNPVDVLEGFRVIYVKPVEGPPAPMAALLADTVANYLNNRDLAAGVRQPKGLAHKYWTLVGRARPIPLDADPDVIAVTEWTLTDESGALVTTHEVRSTGEAWQWEYGDPRILYAIGEDVADALAKVVIKSMPQNTVDPADMGPKVGLGPVSGAPGDGNQSLLRALKTGLRMRGFHIAANDKAADKHIRCEVILTALKNGKENIKLIWSVLEADGDADRRRGPGKPDRGRIAERPMGAGGRICRRGGY